MKLKCKIGRNVIKEVEVHPDDQLCVLLNKLKLYEANDKKAKFVYKGFTYSLASIFTFREINLTTDARINIITPARAGNSK